MQEAAQLGQPYPREIGWPHTQEEQWFMSGTETILAPEITELFLQPPWIFFRKFLLQQPSLSEQESFELLRPMPVPGQDTQRQAPGYRFK